MEKESKKSDAVVGLSASAGVVLGMAAANAVVNKMEAAELEKSDDILNPEVQIDESNVVESAQGEEFKVTETTREDEPVVVAESTTNVDVQINIDASTNVNTNINVNTNTNANTGTGTNDNDDIAVELVAQETIVFEDGSMSDIALYDVEGEAVYVADVDMDGLADIMAADFNGDGYIDDNEIVDVTDEGFMMPRATDLANDLLLADDSLLNNNPDYENNANIDDFYMA